MNRAKQLRKLAKILSAADVCTSRKQAQKLLKKALKVDRKLNEDGRSDRGLQHGLEEPRDSDD